MGSALGIGGGMIGSSLIGGGLSYLGMRGQMGAMGDMRKDWAKQSKKARAEQERMMGMIRADFAPWREAGQRGLESLERVQGQYEGAIQDPNEYIQSPGYDWLQQQGVSAIDRGAAARGKLDSGQNLKDLVTFGQGLASQDYGNYLGRLEGLMNQYSRNAQMGQNATAQTAQFGQRGQEGLTNIRMQRASGGQAPALGQANAQTGFYNNLSNIGSNAVNQYMLYNYLQNIGQSGPNVPPPYSAPQQAWGQSNLNQFHY